MKKPKARLNRIRVLMLFSQALLVCFMVYWLRSEYFSEHEILKKDLTAQLLRSQDFIADSLITVTILDPILKDLQDSSLSAHKTEMIRSVRILPGPGQSPDSKQGLRKIITEKQGIMVHRNPGASPTLTRGVKLMINSERNLPPGIAHAFSHTDTSLLQKIFHASMRRSREDLDSRWTSADADPRHRLLIASPNTPGNALEILFYGKYLLRTIVPQMLFTLVLLSLTGLAFLVTFKSLRSQMHLAAIRNDFISNMSHELKTPVSTVKVALEALGEPEILDDRKTASEYVQMATLELEQLELLVNQTLQTSLLEDGRMLLQKSSVDLRKLTSELLRSLQPRIQQQNAAASIQASDGDFNVSADKLLVQGVIVNILDNALKYAGPSPQIALQLSENLEWVMLSISDDGPGIPPAYAARIFDKFFRVPRGNEHSIKGYGLGLSYASRVMELHGGSISMQPSKEGGCEFILRFKRSES